MLVYQCHSLRILFLHYNRILGRGGAEIAKALQNSEVQVLDISFNSIGGGKRRGGDIVSWPGRNERKLPLSPEEQKE